jgi:sulfate/thiosulfate transport system permease protein
MTAFELRGIDAAIETGVRRNSGLHARDRLAIAGVALLLGFFVLLPLVSIAYEALRAGWPAAAATFADPNARAAIALTGLATVVTVAFNGAFGVLAGWTLTKYRFPGKALLLAIIDLPLTVSPVVAGLALLLCFGTRSPLGAWFAEHGWKIAFAPPGIILATIFVTFPYVARETIALMSETGRELEEAALGMGASLWQTFSRVTFPRARLAILNGLLLCNARALGEFGAVSVISGNIRGLTDTVPLHIDILYNEDNLVGAFTLAAALVIAAIALTLIRSAVEAYRRRAASLNESKGEPWTL